MLMKARLRAVKVLAVLQLASFAQALSIQIDGTKVFENGDVVFRQSDGHTWVGTGHMMANGSLYLVEGNNKAAHPDHTGSAIDYFPELYVGAGDAASPFLSTYKGKINQPFSGDSFGSGNLLLGGTFSTLLATCRKASALMEKDGITGAGRGRLIVEQEQYYG